MSTAAEQLEQHPHIESIRRYLDACSSGDAAGVAACCAPDVVHYFLMPGIKPVHGNEHLGTYWREAVRLISAEWRVEHAIACDDEAVIEWSMQWTSRDDGERYIAHGTEWYAFRDGLISEIRAYYDHAWPKPRNEDTGLVDFPYAERGYTVVERTRNGPQRESAMPAERNVITGRCLCGGVTYSADAEPVVQAVCHCADCQRQTGSPFSVFIGVPQAAFSCQGDTLASFSTTGEDHGGETQRKFCSACGSPVFSIAAVAPELIFIKAGSLDDASWVQPTVEAWTSSAQAWSPRFEHVAHLERGPR